jgi:hypothetical protein
MTLRDSIADDALTVFLVNDDFAEYVTYYPHRYSGETAREPRQIKAVVEREQITAFAEDVATNLPMFKIHVANDSVYGISSEELDTGGDKIGLSPRDGKTAEQRSIISLITQDHGMLVLECR